MTLSQALDTIKYNVKELDIKVCYNNEYDEECTFCKTFVSNDSFKENKEYWSRKIDKFNTTPNTIDLEVRYGEFEVSFLTAKGKEHFFIFASNFK